jgi:hypothetical protein
MPLSLEGDEDLVSYRGVFQVLLLLAAGFWCCMACPDDRVWSLVIAGDSRSDSIVVNSEEVSCLPLISLAGSST